MSGYKHLLLFEYMKDMFSEYWKHESQLIDYFLIDYLISVGYDEIPEIRQIIDAVPYNNPHIYSLESVLNKQYEKELYTKMISDTSFFKLNRKALHRKVTDSGTRTFYGRIMDL